MHVLTGVVAALLLVAGPAVDRDACGADPHRTVYVGPLTALMFGEGMTRAGGLLGWQPFRDQRDADSFSLEFSATELLGRSTHTVYAFGVVLGPVSWSGAPYHVHLSGGKVGEDGFAEVLLGARLRRWCVVLRPEVGVGLWGAGIVAVIQPTVKVGLELHL